ncbi:MAG: glycogen/starch synthase [Bacteroidota bacterium]
MKKTLLHITSEVSPYYKRGGLGDVLGALPKYLSNEEYDNVVISQYYYDRMAMPEECVCTPMEMEIFGIPYYFDCYSLVDDGVQYYFLNLSDQEVFASLEAASDGDQPYKGSSSFMHYLYYGKAVLHLLEGMKQPIAHVLCHDWQSNGLFAFQDEFNALKSKHGFQTITVIHNYEFQGDVFVDALNHLPSSIATVFKNIYAKHHSVSMLALGMEHSDHVATVSQTYAHELTSGNVPHKGLKYLVPGKKIYAFTNGADYALWHPSRSPFLSQHYDSRDLRPKRILKKEIFEACNFEMTGDLNDHPLLLVMSRLTYQKGIQLILQDSHENAVAGMEKLLGDDLRMVIYGAPTGGLKGEVHEKFVALQSKFEGRLFYNPVYTEPTAHQYLAGADIFMAPSLFEPCGLTQIYAMAFGTVPVVRPIGGLKDTVNDYGDSPSDATGFYIKEFTSESMIQSIHEAKTLYINSPEKWLAILQRGMQQDFSWDKMKENYYNYFDATRPRQNELSLV